LELIITKTKVASSGLFVQHLHHSNADKTLQFCECFFPRLSPYTVFENFFFRQQLSSAVCSAIINWIAITKQCNGTILRSVGV